MKLRNKKTGETGFLRVALGLFNGVEKFLVELATDEKMRFQYGSLAELHEVWEDYEEPKEYWYINQFGSIVQVNYNTRENIYDKSRKSFGNYFETREEAEKAVEKLMAWKRLKDKGFHISGWDNSIGDDYYKPSQIVIELNGNPEWDEYDNIEDIKADLDLLFGGEE